MARDYFLAALDDLNFETRVSANHQIYGRQITRHYIFKFCTKQLTPWIDDVKSPSTDGRDTHRVGRTPTGKSSHRRIRGIVGDFTDQQLEAFEKRVAQMGKLTACINTEAQKKIYMLETEA